MARSRRQKAHEAKLRGNTDAKRKHYYSAIIHYTESIKMDPNDATVLTNRSLCFLKMAQHFLALEDAKRAIKLQPEWSKGYYRKGQVYYNADKYDESVEAYKEGLEKCPDDETLKLALEKVLEKKNEKDKKENWYTNLGMRLGLLVGVLIVIGDEMLSTTAFMSGYKWKLLCIAIFVISGAGCAEMWSQFWKMTSDAMLMPDENWFKAASGGFTDEYKFEGERSQAMQTAPDIEQHAARMNLDKELKKGVVIEEISEDEEGEATEDVQMEDIGEDLMEDLETKKDK